MKKWHKIFNQRVLTVRSAEEMRQLGVEIGKLLERGDTLALVGNLGAGKTHLSQGIIEGLGASSHATSPTFSLVHEHTDGRAPAYHFDFYRLKSEHELFSIGWDDYVAKNDIIIVEWADMYPAALPQNASWLLISHENDTTRRVELKIL